jgi:hypothetical protein
MTLGQGMISTALLSDLDTLTNRLNAEADDPLAEMIFSVAAGATPNRPVGLALYSPFADSSGPAAINGIPPEDGARVGLRILYER